MNTPDSHLQPRGPEKFPINPQITKEIAEHILTNPDFIFSEYQKMLQLLSTKASITPREVSIIYRRELGDTKNPEFMFNQWAISWLILNTPETLSSPVEMVNMVETLSGIDSQDIPLQTSEEVEQLTAGTSKQVKAKLLEVDDNDISDFIAGNASENTGEKAA